MAKQRRRPEARGLQVSAGRSPSEHAQQTSTEAPEVSASPTATLDAYEHYAGSTTGPPTPPYSPVEEPKPWFALEPSTTKSATPPMTGARSPSPKLSGTASSKALKVAVRDGTEDHNGRIGASVGANAASVTLGSSSQISDGSRQDRSVQVGTSDQGLSARLTQGVAHSNGGYTDAFIGVRGDVVEGGVGHAWKTKDGMAGAAAQAEFGAHHMAGSAGGSYTPDRGMGLSADVNARMEEHIGTPLPLPDGRWLVKWNTAMTIGGGGGVTLTGFAAKLGVSVQGQQLGQEVFDSKVQAEDFRASLAENVRAMPITKDDVQAMEPGTTRGWRDGGVLHGAVGLQSAGGISAIGELGGSDGVQTTRIDEHTVRVEHLKERHADGGGRIDSPVVAGQATAGIARRVFEAWDVDLQHPAAEYVLPLLLGGGKPPTQPGVIYLGETVIDETNAETRGSPAGFSFQKKSADQHIKQADGTVDYAAIVASSGKGWGAAATEQGQANFPQAGGARMELSVSHKQKGAVAAAQDAAAFAGAKPSALAYLLPSDTKGVKLERVADPRELEQLQARMLKEGWQLPGAAGDQLARALRDAGNDSVAVQKAWAQYIGDAGPTGLQYLAQMSGSETYLDVEDLPGLEGREQYLDLEHEVLFLEKGSAVDPERPRELWTRLRTRERSLLQTSSIGAVPPEVCREELDRTRSLLARLQRVVQKVGGPSLGMAQASAGTTVKARESMFDARARYLDERMRHRGALRQDTLVPETELINRKRMSPSAVQYVNYSFVDAQIKRADDALSIATELEAILDRKTADEEGPQRFADLDAKYWAAEQEYKIAIEFLLATRREHPGYFQARTAGAILACDY